MRSKLLDCTYCISLLYIHSFFTDTLAIVNQQLRKRLRSLHRERVYLGSLLLDKAAKRALDDCKNLDGVLLDSFNNRKSGRSLERCVTCGERPCAFGDRVW